MKSIIRFSDFTDYLFPIYNLQPLPVFHFVRNTLQNINPSVG